MNPKLKHLLIGEFSLKRLVRSLLFVYVSIGIYGYFFSERMIFIPQPASYSQLPGMLMLNSANEKQIAAVYLANPQADYTILYSHGNAEDLGDILPVLTQFQNIGFSVLSFDYQGYGISEGNPTERRAVQDMEAAYFYLTETLKIPPERIIVYGRSVGGGPALELAARYPVGGLVVESSFTSIFRTVTRIPIYPVDKFNNIRNIQRVNCPVLVIHGTEDEVIPFWHGEALFAAAPEPKQALWVEGAGHNDLIQVAGDRHSAALLGFVGLLEGNKPAE
ncbi:alpha/beta hydrolase [Oscillatoria sp. HE19RPO]|uniref:alpha/beta hydrolase n=1 Tax=Oscillatoria sp. HE19RPO TaxID=2954806 RepID=UPI0020C52A9D|nr:alpha/beta hydrolase [Oscillatoria sp. HE19RPO]